MNLQLLYESVLLANFVTNSVNMQGGGHYFPPPLFSVKTTADTGAGVMAGMILGFRVSCVFRWPSIRGVITTWDSKEIIKDY